MTTPTTSPTDERAAAKEDRRAVHARHAVMHGWVEACGDCLLAAAEQEEAIAATDDPMEKEHLLAMLPGYADFSRAMRVKTRVFGDAPRQPRPAVGGVRQGCGGPTLDRGPGSCTAGNLCENCLRTPAAGIPPLDVEFPVALHDPCPNCGNDVTAGDEPGDGSLPDGGKHDGFCSQACADEYRGAENDAAQLAADRGEPQRPARVDPGSRDWRTEIDEAFGPLRVDQLDAAERLLQAHAGAVVADMADLLEAAWGVIANAGGWDVHAGAGGVTRASPGWLKAAGTWRDSYFALRLPRSPAGPQPPPGVGLGEEVAWAAISHRLGILEEAGRNIDRRLGALEQAVLQATRRSDADREMMRRLRLALGQP